MDGDTQSAEWLRRSVIKGLTAGLLSSPSPLQAQPLVQPPPPPTAPTPEGDGPSLEEVEAVLAASADRADRMTVPVMVNGAGPFSFIVDTGSNRTVVSEILAARLDLPMAEALQVRAATGVVQTASVRVGSLTVGGRRLDHLQAPVLAARNLGALGMLGIDALAKQRIVMDFHNRRMSVSSRRRRQDDAGALLVRARSKYGQLLLVDSSVEGVALYVILDTGGEQTIGNLAMRNLLARRRNEEAKAVELISVTGDSMAAGLSLLRELQLGHVRVLNQPVAYADMFAFDQFGLRDKPSMLLGMSTLRHFSKVQIDFPAREVSFLLES
jgi:predicted aspartyl protease